jgi:hypothetical protein
MTTMAMTGFGGGTPFAMEDHEMEAANELLSVGNEQELEEFLGSLVSSIGKGLRSVGRAVAPALSQLAPVLKTVAKVGLPLAARAAGTFFGGPAGAAIGGKIGDLVAGQIKEMEAELEETFGEVSQEEREQFLGDIVSGLIGGEAESMAPADRQVEAAKRLVRIANTAAHTLVKQPSGESPTHAAMSAIQSATQKLGLTPTGHKHSGRWVRRGNHIVIFGA